MEERLQLPLSGSAPPNLDATTTETTSSAHVANNEKGRQGNQANESIFRCSFCDRDFETMLGRNAHEKTHEAGRHPSYTCKMADCGKSFANKGSLKVHIQSVSHFQVLGVLP